MTVEALNTFPLFISLVSWFISLFVNLLSQELLWMETNKSYRIILFFIFRSALHIYTNIYNVIMRGRTKMIEKREKEERKFKFYPHEHFSILLKDPKQMMMMMCDNQNFLTNGFFREHSKTNQCLKTVKCSIFISVVVWTVTYHTNSHVNFQCLQIFENKFQFEQCILAEISAVNGIKYFVRAKIGPYGVWP